jgi:adenylate cyclase
MPGMPMGTEIERKFLVAGTGWRGAVTRSVEMRQGYLANSPACSVRVRLEGDHARLNIKSATFDIERQEYDYAIPVGDARTMLETLCGGRFVSKTRHYLAHCGHTWEIDEFADANAGLIVAEIELDAVDESFVKPEWIGEEVSHDRRYYNVSLLEHPYTHW